MMKTTSEIKEFMRFIMQYNGELIIRNTEVYDKETDTPILKYSK